MDPHEGFRLTYQILTLFKYFFMAAPAIVIIMTVFSLFDIKNKTFRQIFNYRDTINSLTTLFTLLIVGLIGLFFCIYRVVYFLNTAGKAPSYSPLVTQIVIPIFNLKAPSLNAIINEIKLSSIFIIPVVICMFLGILLKWKDTASKTMIIMASLTLLLLLFTYKFYMIYWTLFAIRALY